MMDSGKGRIISPHGCGAWPKESMLPIFQWMALCPSISELSRLEAKHKRLGEDVRPPGEMLEGKWEMYMIKIHCMYVRNPQRIIRKCVFK